jgi:hypothetical protein
MMAGYLRRILENEMVKGCRPDISLDPVELEPPYRWFNSAQELLDTRQQPPFVKATCLPDESDLTRFTVWVNSAHIFDWFQAERFLRELQTLCHRVAFNICGNQDALEMSFLCHKEDEVVLKAVFCAVFPDCELAPAASNSLTALSSETWGSLVFKDFYTPPPYSELLTRSNQLSIPPLRDFASVLRFVAPPSVAVYQVVLQPVDPAHDWHRNVGLLIDMLYYYKLCMGYGAQQRLPQQMPTGQLSHETVSVQTKSDRDKPFFAAAVRIGLLGHVDGAATALLRGLTVPMNLFLHGGRQLESASHTDYAQCLEPARVRDMFLIGRSHRSGALLNSLECAGLLHLFPVVEFAQRGISVHVVDAFPTSSVIFTGGIHIGETVRTAQPRNVYIPDKLVVSHIHAQGKTGKGKSHLLCKICLEMASAGQGVAILDPHGDLGDMFLACLREEWMDRVIALDFGDPIYIPIWNPLAQRTNVRPSRLTDDFLNAFTRITNNWGDRLETLLAQAFYGLIQTGQGTLADAATLFAPKGGEREAIRRRILDVVINRKAREFWEHEFETYRGDQVAAVQHKLTKLLLDDTLNLMLSQPDSLLDFRKIMDEGMLLVVNLSALGSPRGDLIGALILSLLHLTALGRSDTPPERRRPYLVCADEAPRFVTDSLEHMIGECRKYKVGLLLAHQSLGQFPQRSRVEALGTVGTTIIFNTSADDAPHAAKSLGPEVDPKELTRLVEREAMVRIDTDVVRVMTPWLEPPADTSIRERAKQLSRERYCRPASELLVLREKRGGGPKRPIVATRSGEKGMEIPAEYTYDEFRS